MAPRTSEFSARPARRTTSPYHAGKSSDWRASERRDMNFLRVSTDADHGVGAKGGSSRRSGPEGPGTPTSGPERSPGRLEPARRGAGSPRYEANERSTP